MVDDSWDWQSHDPRGLLHLLHDNFWVSEGAHITIDPQGLIIRADYVEARKLNMTEIPVPFLKVDGNFTIKRKSLRSLKNSPREVTGSFDVSDNQLTSLAHGPTVVGEHYMCSYNRLTNLVGAPKHVSGYFEVLKNPLESLEGLPQGISYFTVSNNSDKTLPLLRSLSVQGRVAVTQREEDKKWGMTLYDITLNEILNDPRWHGKGKSGMLNCALELKKAGYEGNARW